MVHLVISVPVQDSESLSSLEREVTAGAAVNDAADIELRSLDGETVAILVVALTSQSIQTVGQWLVARARAKKSTSVTLDGVKVTADTVADVERLFASLKLRGDRRGRSARPSNVRNRSRG